MNLTLEAPVAGQRFFAPEVVQTSAMDCGPAALKSLLEGFGVRVSYGRLREACQTDVDGTSINTLEDIAIQLGLQAEQVMLPADHLALSEAQALPAIVVVQRPSGLTHFLVVWNRVGDLLQVMDPATGRRWLTWKRFQDEIYIHTFPVPTQAWREWAGSEGLLSPLQRRMRDLGLEQSQIQSLVESAVQDPGWRSLATLDAAVRMTTALVRARGLVKGEQAGNVLGRFFTLNLQGPLPRLEAVKPGGGHSQVSSNLPGSASPPALMIPALYWSALPVITPEVEAHPEQEPERLNLRGAVLVRILGRLPSSFEPVPGDLVLEKPTETETGVTAKIEPETPEALRRDTLPPDLQAALKEQTYHPIREVWKALREDGLLTPTMLALALMLSTFGVTVEALLFQGMIQIGQSLSQTSQRAVAAISAVAFVVGLLLLELPISSTIQRMGRRLEVRLRMAFLDKLPRLGDRYFRSRLASDMTQRAHDLRSLRTLPNLGVGLLRTGFQLLLTAAGVIWLDARSAPLAILASIVFVSLTFLTQPLLEERDLRLRTHVGALSRFYLDALLGLVPAKTHGAERAMLRQHENQLYEWVRTGREYYSVASLVQSFGVLLYSAFSILIMVNYIRRGGQPGEILLLFYWTLNLPALGQSLADQIQTYPMLRNRVLRLLEPLSAPDEEDLWSEQSAAPAGPAVAIPAAEPDASQPALSVQIEHVLLQAGGHVILEDVDLSIAAGEHIAVVGPSGAGKSSLVGLLLGWHRPSRGRIQVDGQALDGPRLVQLRRETAWVDPAVQLWNRSLYDNLRYGIEHEQGSPLSAIIQRADLYDVLDRLPDGLKTVLGESGGLVSGGEGQRVRLGRAMLRQEIRLAVLDEPFRGLDRDKRRKLLLEARDLWQGVTLLCVTHDVGETLQFPRVLVIEEGHIIEDGNPAELAAQPESRYRQLLDAEEAVRNNLWGNVGWRRLIIDSGKLSTDDNQT
jgi:ABC-type bacteriocin/lantibiotic exporter with double-glycine peptidase domain